MDAFLKAVIYENKGDFKKAIQLLNPLMYSNQYFFTVFARLLLLKIHLKRENRSLCKSLIESTQKYLKQNSGNQLGMISNEFTLNVFKKKITQRKETDIVYPTNVLSVFHHYLLR